MNLVVYAFLSTVLLIGTVTHTYIQQEHLYPTLVALTQEKVQLTVIYNFLFMVLVVVMNFIVLVFVGKLTPAEYEQLVDNGRSMVADTLLFLIFYSPTINGKELPTTSLVQYIGLILVLKVFHSIAQIRTSRMFEIGVPSNMNIIRVGTLLTALVLVDLSILSFVSSLLDRVSTFYTWLLFEFINVSLASISTLLKYIFNLIDVKFTAQGWPSKSVYIFYTDLVTDILQMTCYIMFMGIFFYQNPSRLPIYAIADVVQVARQLATRLQSFKRYREITSNMDKKFPEASPEEMASAESCIICRDTLSANCKVLACGHIFHTDCLKNWAVVQQICPTCRADLVPRAGASKSRPSSQVSAPASSPGGPALVQEPASAPVPVASSASRSEEPTVPHLIPHSSGCLLVEDELVKSIEHAREMAIFYKEQMKFWISEIKAIQNSLAPPAEPDSLKSVINRLRSEIKSESIATSQPISKSPSESDFLPTDFNEVRKARQRKYEDQMRNRSDPNHTNAE